MVAIDVEFTEYVDPTPAVWGTWVAAAAERHVSEADLDSGEEIWTMLVAEQDLVQVGRYEGGCVLVDHAGRQKLQPWIHAGRMAVHLTDPAA